jgi:murein DD-endopeptidase MepM/ murein hydrolase activator NlpD
MNKYIIFLLFCYVSCTSNKISQNRVIENRNQEKEKPDSFKIDLSDLNVGNIKREMIDYQPEELDDTEIVEEIANSINIFLTEEEKRFFDLGKKAPVISRFFEWPLKVVKRISSKFGMRNKKMHKGIDIPADKNTKVLASNDGIVSFSGKKKG